MGGQRSRQGMVRRLAVLLGSAALLLPLAEPVGQRTGAVARTLLAMAATAMATPVQAQTTTFVSNIGQTDRSGNRNVSNFVWRAQQFETGDDSAGGYTLGEIVVNVKEALTGTPAFALYTSTASNRPGTKIVDLSGDSSTAGQQSFTPNSSTVLQQSTKYFIMFIMSSGNSNLQGTSSNNVDAGASSGWDINSRSLTSFDLATNWAESGTSIEIAVKGTPVASDDTAGVSVAPTTLTLDEGGTITYTVTLDTQPTGNVTLTPTNSDTGAVSLSPASLTFTTTNWDTAQTVSVAAVEDDDANDETVTVSHSVSGYGAVSVAAAVTVTVTDDDTAGVRVSTASETINEGEATSYTVMLDSQPGGPVTLTPTSGDTDAVSVSSASLTFTTTNWDTAQTVSVTAVEDDDANDETVTVSHGVSGYGAVTAAAVTVTVVDDDVDTTAPTVTITGVPSTSDKPFTATISFSEMVDGFVESDIMVSDNARLSAFRATSSGMVWEVVVTPTASGTVTLDIGAAVATDGANNDNTAATQVSSTYTAPAPPPGREIWSGRLTVQELNSLQSGCTNSFLSNRCDDSSILTDDDFEFNGVTYSVDAIRSASTGGFDFRITPVFSGESGINEAALQAALALTVDGQPVSSILLNPGSGESTISKNLSIPWSAGQEVEIKLFYNDTTPPTVVFMRWSSPTMSPTNANELAWLVQFSEVVKNVDAADFTVSGTSATVSGITESTTQLGMLYNVTVSGGDLNDYDGTVTLGFATGQDIVDEAGNTLTATTPTGANENSYVLDNTAPTITYTAPHSLTVGTTITVITPTTAATDIESYSATPLPPGLTVDSTSGDINGAPTTATTTPTTVTVTVTDAAGNEGSTTLVFPMVAAAVAPGVSITPPADLSITEGSTLTYTVKPDTDPGSGATVTITPSLSGDSGAVSLSTTSLTFTTANWETARMVTVTAMEDDDRTDETVTINHNVNGYGSLTAADAVTVTVTDDDVPAVDVCERTPEVRDIIIEGIAGITTCTEVSVIHLQGITFLSVFGESNLSSLQEDDFDNLSKLKDLYLENNSLSSLPANIFNNLSSVTTIALNGNSLGSLPGGIFNGLSALSTLNLHNNNLSSLPEGVFNGLSALRVLNLSDNELTSLPAGIFNGLSSLRTLRLQRNSLNNLDTSIFANLSSLRELNLQENTLSTLQTGIFNNLSTLTILTLNDNSLTSLPDVIFADLSNLERLTLTNNVLMCLPRSSGAPWSRVANRNLTLDLPDCFGVSLSVTPTEVAEGGNGESITVSATLNAGERASSVSTQVTISIEEGTATDMDFTTVEPFTITIPNGSDSATGTFTLIATADSEREPDGETVLVSGTSTEGSYSAEVGSATVTIKDTPGVTVTPTSLTPNEGETTTYTVTLATQPTGNVTITPSNSDTSAVSLSPASITFTTTNWDTPKTVSVTAVDDENTDDETVTISHDVSGYGSVTAAAVTVAVEDAGDTTAPQVSSISLQTPTAPGFAFVTNADSLIWRVTFSEDVRNVDGTDFTVTANGGSGITVTDVEPVSGQSRAYDVTASGGNLATLNGVSVKLVFVSGQNIEDLAGNALANTTPTGVNEFYLLDNDAPTVNFIRRDDPSNPRTNANTLSWHVQLFDSRGVKTNSVDKDDFMVTGGSTATVTSFRSSGAGNFTVVISGGDLEDYNGEVGLGFASGQDIEDVIGNPLTATTPTGDNEAYELDNTVTVGYTVPEGLFLSVGTAIPPIMPETTDTDIESYSAITLPAGLTIDASNGEISGTPTTATAASSEATVTVTDDLGNNVVVTLTFPAVVEPGVRVDPASLPPVEGQTLSYGVVLDTPPSGPVTIATSNSDSGAVSLSPASLTFTTANWDTPRTVSVTAVDDSDTNSETVTVSHSVSGYGSVTAADAVTISVTDDDTPGVNVQPTSDDVNEGQTLTYTVRLTTQPSGPVTITSSLSGDSSAVSISPASLTFTSSDWSARMVTVTAVEDDVDTDNQSVTISHSVSGYGTITVADPVTVTVTDNDTAGVSVIPPANDDLNEGGTSTYTLVLTSEPTGNVTISPATSGDSGAVHVEPASLTFTTANWDTARTVTVTAMDDDIATGNQSVTVSHSVSGYEGVSIVDAVTVTVTDDDTAGVTVMPPASDDLNEGGTLTYTLVLTSEPTDNVTITLTTSGDSSAVSVEPASLTFTTANWDTARTVTVTAMDDDIATGNQSVTVSHSVSGYEGVSIVDAVTVTVTDNDTAGVTVTPPANDDLSEGGTLTYTLQLNTQPSGPVTISPTSSDSGAVSVEPARLTITSSDWETPRTVTVTAVDDDVNTGNQTITVSHSVSGYGAITVADPVTVTVADDDTAPVTVTPEVDDTDNPIVPMVSIAGPSSAMVNEGDALTFTLILDQAAPTDLTVELTVTETGEMVSEAHGGSRQVTVTQGQNQAVFTVATENDETDETDSTVTVMVVADSATPATYGVGPAPEAVATVADDDDAALETDAEMETGTDVATETGMNEDVTPTDTTAPTVTYAAPTSLTVGTAITLNPTTEDSDIASYDATGLPVGLTIDSSTGAISGTPTTASDSPATVTVTVTDTTGNATEVTLMFPVVELEAVREERVAREEAQVVLDEVVVPNVVQQLTAETIEVITSRLATITARPLPITPPPVVPTSVVPTPATPSSPSVTTPIVSLAEDLLADTLVALYGQRERLKDGSFEWQQAFSGRDFVLPLSSLNLAQGENIGAQDNYPFSTLAIWGGGDYSSYNNLIEDMDVEGDGFSATIGMDLQPIPQLVTGLALTTSRWGLDYATNGATAKGTYDVGITVLNPYLSWSATNQLSLWATVGYGRGEVEHNPEGDDTTTRTDTLTSWAGGVRFEVVPGGNPHTGEGAPFGLALKGDGAASSFLDRQVQLARLAAEVSRSFTLENGLLSAALELGWSIRTISSASNDTLSAQQQAIAEQNHSGGGAELAGNLNWRNVDGSVSATVDTRVLLGGGHHREWGIGGYLLLTPSQRNGEGLSLTLQPSFGVTGTRLDELWSLTGNSDLANNNNNPSARLDVQLAYGFPLGNAIFTPYTELTWAETANVYGAGLRYGLNPFLELDLKGNRRNNADGNTEHHFSLDVRSDL